MSDKKENAESMSKPRTALFQGGEDDEPMAQIVTKYDHDKKCFLFDNADGEFTDSGLSLKIIF